jgi:uncharacterized membrane protein HdeD (DUF308 family)
MVSVLAIDPWWAFVVRGVLAILFGVLTFLLPGMTLATLVALFGIYAIAEGAFNFAGGLRRVERTPPRWIVLLAGLASIIAGFIAFLRPGLTALSLLYLIAAWAIARGAIEIVAAIRLRKEIVGEWLFILSGILSVAFGVLVMAFPATGALAVLLWIGSYSLLFGAMLVAIGVKLRNQTQVRGPGGGFRDLATGESR